MGEPYAAVAMKHPPPPPPSPAAVDDAATWVDGVAAGVAALPVKVAVTLRARLIVVVQVPVPVQAPLQPVKVEPEDAAAVRVTVVPLANALLQGLLHAIPPGEEVTVPDPVPLVFRVRVYVVEVPRAKVAVTLLPESTTRVQLPVPVQAPLQPVKVEPEAGVALSAMLVPEVNEALQVLPQSTPPGLDATVPLPAPAVVTVTV
ncbi:MAG: hypothetical protein A2Z31_02025 [candidate division NC10 bacterium RBG_16_65_8]|nr:MAG: hypothetical protein A2Z31_02025 [candidate division NC10 bacterium RBG_16_65_8]